MKLKDIAKSMANSNEYKELTRLMDPATIDLDEETTEKITLLYNTIVEKLQEGWKAFVGEVFKSWELKGNPGKVGRNALEEKRELQAILEKHLENEIPVFMKLKHAFDQAKAKQTSVAQ